MLLGNRHFWKNSSGSMAINFALALTTLLIGVGVAIDYGSLTSVKSNLQDLADTTALAAAVTGDSTQPELQFFAEKYVEEIGDFSPNINGADVNVNVVLKSKSFVVELTQKQDLFVLSAFGQEERQVFADAEVRLPGASDEDRYNFNVALVRTEVQTIHWSA